LRRDHMSLSITLSERVVLGARAAYLVRSSGMWCAPERDTVPFLSFLSVLSYYLCTPPAWWEEGKHVARHLWAGTPGARRTGVGHPGKIGRPDPGAKGRAGLSSEPQREAVHPVAAHQPVRPSLHAAR